MTSEPSKPCPSLRANPWSQFFLGWITELFDKCRDQGTLYLTDLYDLLPNYQSAQLVDDLEIHWFEELKRNPEKPSLLRATLHAMRWKPVLIGSMLIPTKLVSVARPLLILYLMEFFRPCPTMSIQWAFFLASCTIFSALLSSITHQVYSYSIQCLGLQMRVAYHGLIYRKILRLSSHSLNTFSSGQVTNVFANDASHVETAIVGLNYIWGAVFDILVMMGFFWYFIKYVMIIAIGYTVLLVLLESALGHVLVYFRTRILQVIDERVKIMSEIIKSMRIVKMYCWESAFEKKIYRIRKEEILRCAVRLALDSLQMLLSHTSFCVTFFLLYAAMWTWDIRFDTRFFAVASCLLGYLEVSVLDFGASIHTIAQYISAEQRIQTFLLLAESERDHRLTSTSVHDLQAVKPEEKKKTESAVRIECSLKEAKWQKNAVFSLKNIVFKAAPGDLICVIGPVGSGKSSLLQTLSGEIAFFDGKARLHGSFCYVPQESWIFSSTLKKNILFGKEHDPTLFRKVIHAAALEADLIQLTKGVNTLVGDQGVMLSGGQKARVNLARALYRDADIYLLDDPLSAVDVKVSKHLFERTIKGYLREKICILVTHQIQFLRDATKIFVLDNGEMVQMGTYTELLASSESFRRLLDNIHQQEQQHQQQEKTDEIRLRASSRRPTSLDRENDDGLSDSLETKNQGSVHWRVYLSFLQAGAGLVAGVIFVSVVFGLRELVFIFYSWWLAEWSDDEGHRHQLRNNCTDTKQQKVETIQSMNETEWIRYRNGRFFTCCVITVIVIILSLLRIVVGKLLCLNAGRVLHNQMFRRLIRCPIAFFDVNPAGRILNRFTKDIDIIDEYIPWTLFDFLQCLFQVLGVIALVSWLNPWSFIPALLAVISMLLLRNRFAQCSRDLKRLENLTRSPIYSYLTSTIDGLKVIRSYKAEQICSTEFCSHLNVNTQASFLSITTNRWIGSRFDWITMAYIAAITMLALVVQVIGRSFSTADIALTLSFSLNLMGLLQWTIRQSVQVETQMTSVERVLEYCALDQEPPAQVAPACQPPAHWPSSGQIVFETFSMSYSKDPYAPVALDRISLTIQAGEKIGIVGRTGAGKSSFIQTLFRMGSHTTGRICIDQIDIDTVGLDDVRRRISIIPQDPVLFTGTMRSNLDQFGDYSDAEIWYALEQVQLKKLVVDILPNGLQSLVSESGSNLSVGQKQLVCLARAILKKNKILVIDEATANVDNATDELIQQAIREKFRDCTVLTVAHRLRTVIDSDRILVLGNGKVLEFAQPDMLLSDSTSHFTSLVQQTGLAEAEHLRRLANAMKTNGQLLSVTGVLADNDCFDVDEKAPLI